MMIMRSMGLVGLGVMGRNLALNMAEKGVAVVAYDPWDDVRTSFSSTLDADESNLITVSQSIKELVASLPGPRTLLIMVKAGEPVDVLIEQLSPLLQEGDTLIDGGNSHYQDTIRRQAALDVKGIHFIGLGISGGEEGARHGPSMMAGATARAYNRVRRKA